jgi:hypothetical protein
MQTLIDQLKERAVAIQTETGIERVSIYANASAGAGAETYFGVHLHGEESIYTATASTIEEAERRARDEMATGENPETAAALYEKQAAELTAKAQKIRMNGKPE